MKKVLLLLSMTLCMAACTIDSEDNRQADSFLAPGTPAPDFTIATGQAAGDISLSSLRGAYVMLHFWASWCPDCRRETPQLTALHTAFAPKGVTFVGVSFDTDTDAFRQYTADNGIDWMQRCDFVQWKESEISPLYNVRWIPTYYLIDPDGRIAGAAVTAEEMKTMLEKTAH